ncbi:hypothetical protein E2C01_054900 [Portunus trituberculatus]|uniref:Uncharacterized protein n=1 Tax=Portunus trituberculatus TaxID=210409 RepID=A0A5B7GL14_PORTR|nr:hypothetical protein [Portunus trituberculatus]
MVDQSERWKGVQIQTIPLKRECILSPGSLIRKRRYIQGQTMSQCHGKQIYYRRPSHLEDFPANYGMEGPL